MGNEFSKKFEKWAKRINNSKNSLELADVMSKLTKEIGKYIKNRNFDDSDKEVEGMLNRLADEKQQALKNIETELLLKERNAEKEEIKAAEFATRMGKPTGRAHCLICGREMFPRRFDKKLICPLHGTFEKQKEKLEEIKAEEKDKELIGTYENARSDSKRRIESGRRMAAEIKETKKWEQNRENYIKWLKKELSKRINQDKYGIELFLNHYVELGYITESDKKNLLRYFEKLKNEKLGYRSSGAFFDRMEKEKLQESMTQGKTVNLKEVEGLGAEEKGKKWKEERKGKSLFEKIKKPFTGRLLRRGKTKIGGAGKKVYEGKPSKNMEKYTKIILPIVAIGIGIAILIRLPGLWIIGIPAIIIGIGYLLIVLPEMEKFGFKQKMGVLIIITGGLLSVVFGVINYGLALLFLGGTLIVYDWLPKGKAKLSVKIFELILTLALLIAGVPAFLSWSGITISLVPLIIFSGLNTFLLFVLWSFSSGQSVKESLEEELLKKQIEKTEAETKEIEEKEEGEEETKEIEEKEEGEEELKKQLEEQKEEAKKKIEKEEGLISKVEEKPEVYTGQRKGWYKFVKNKAKAMEEYNRRNYLLSEVDAGHITKDEMAEILVEMGEGE